jgi:ribokinase
METMKIVVLGSSNTDMIIQLPRIPRPGETLLGGRFTMAAGGKGANQAVAAARAGGRVQFIARVGNDMFGTRALEAYSADRIDASHVYIDSEEPSGTALIFVAESGENSIGVAPGANARLSTADVEKCRGVLESADILLMQLETSLESVAAAAAIAKSATIILNPAPAAPVPPGLLARIALLTPNESEAEVLTGIPIADDDALHRAADMLLGFGPRTVLITLGARGALLASREAREIVPGFEVDAVDSTAAGDVFNGALAVAVAEGLEIRSAVRFAHAAAALTVTRLGAQPSIPGRDEIDRFLRSKIASLR